jgi:hypothetical protein
MQGATVSDIRFALVLLAAATFAACAPEATQPPGVTYTKDIQPILAYKCSPCHSTDGDGMHNIASNYDDAHKPVHSVDSVGCWNDVEMTMPKTVGECSLISAKNGRMPYLFNCALNPTLPVCVQPAEQDLMAAWIAAGMPR